MHPGIGKRPRTSQMTDPVRARIAFKFGGVSAFCGRRGGLPASRISILWKVAQSGWVFRPETDASVRRARSIRLCAWRANERRLRAATGRNLAPSPDLDTGQASQEGLVTEVILICGSRLS